MHIVYYVLLASGICRGRSLDSAGRPSRVSRVLIHTFGVVPNVRRNISTKALDWRYPTLYEASLIELPEINNSTAFVNRTCRRHDSKLVLTSLRKVLSMVLTLTPALTHRAAIVFDSAGFRETS